MEKIYYTDKCAFVDTDSAIRYLLSEFYALKDARILRTENGKPILDGTPFFLSVSHTKDRLFIALSRDNVGLDAEDIQRVVDYSPIVKKFKPEERGEIRCTEAFLRHWTAKEAAVKWLGGTLARDLYKLDYIGGKMRYGELELPAKFTFLRFGECLLCVCGERDFEEAELIEFSNKKENVI